VHERGAPSRVAAEPAPRHTPPKSGLQAPQLSRWELATGLALGADPHPAGGEPPAAAPTAPRAALARALTEALARSPCVVSFSGGRDSSAVLAAATNVARRQGLPDPVPVTLRFPGVASTEESRWQELVVEHLGLREWERITVESELDLLGPVAREALRAHGLLWPPNAHIHVPILERARGGCVLTGLDGDGLFGHWRWVRAQAVLHGRAAPRPRDPLRVALALASPRARQRWMRPHVLSATPWIRPEARGELEALARTDASREPRRHDRRIDYYRRRRYLSLTARSLELLGAARSVEVRHPLLGPVFLAALARDGGAAGYGDRTAAMRTLFGDLLPAELVARRGKAEFSRALWKAEAHAFAASWSGSGVDQELVDPERLREAWRSPTPWFGANTLLHEAWLAAQPK
jgi:asparagine synthetase B (glutamine-hydrolysing)